MGGGEEGGKDITRVALAATSKRRSQIEPVRLAARNNAVIESWFSTVKSEEGERFESYAHAKEALVDYIGVFYNQRRRHSTLGHISPAEFERRAGYAA